MINRNQKSALAGLTVWLVLLLAFVGLIIFLFANRGSEGLPDHVSESKIMSAIFWSVLLLLLSFVWTCYYLAMAKGYPPLFIFLGLLGPPAQLAILVGLLLVRDKNSREPNLDQPSRRRHHGSQLERIVIYRRNALVGNFFGLIGIAAGVFVVLFRLGLFRDRGNEIVFGMLVFLAGYAGVITGCWWWLKAKSWIDAIVFIGLLPLGICLIPYVRLIYLSIPMLLPIGMVFMPIVLLVVVFVLPDRSGWEGRKRWRMQRGGEE